LKSFPSIRINLYVQRLVAWLYLASYCLYLCVMSITWNSLCFAFTSSQWWEQCILILKRVNVDEPPAAAQSLTLNIPVDVWKRTTQNSVETSPQAVQINRIVEPANVEEENVTKYVQGRTFTCFLGGIFSPTDWNPGAFKDTFGHYLKLVFKYYFIYSYSIWAIVIQIPIIRILGSSLQIQSVFLDKKRKEKKNINQKKICILIYLWLFIVIKQFETTINNYNLFLCLLIILILIFVYIYTYIYVYICLYILFIYIIYVYIYIYLYILVRYI